MFVNFSLYLRAAFLLESSFYNFVLEKDKISKIERMSELIKGVADRILHFLQSGLSEILQPRRSAQLSREVSTSKAS